MNSNSLKVGVFVDAENIRLNGGRFMRYDILRRFANRDGGNLLRLNSYFAYDSYADQDKNYSEYLKSLHRQGWKIQQKEVKRYRDEEGNETVKANADLDLAVDALIQSANLDRVLLVTGDGDFVRVVTGLQDKGCRVEVMGCQNVSTDLKMVADDYYSAFMIPDLIPVTSADEGMPQREEGRPKWGEIGSRVRGNIYHWKEDFGFFRVIRTISDELWNTDFKDPNCPYLTIFCHKSFIASSDERRLVNHRDAIFEFTVAESPKNSNEKEAHDVKLTYCPTTSLSEPKRRASLFRIRR